MNETVPSQLNRLDTERIKGYKTLLDFYYGIQWAGRERWGERRLTFNYAKVFIEKITSYLMSGISYAVEPMKDNNSAKEKAGKAISALYRVHEENYLEQLDLETEKKRVLGISLEYSPLKGEYIQHLKLGAV